jgi:hypothetical protein
VLLWNRRLAPSNGILGDQPPPFCSCEGAGDQTGNVPDGLGAQWSSLFRFSMTASDFEEPVPFTAQMKRRNLSQRHGQQFGREIAGQFPVALDRLSSKFLFRVLTKELAEKHRECGGKCLGHRTTPSLCQLVLLEFLGTSLCLGVVPSCLLAKPTASTNRRSCRVEPGALKI